MNCQRFEEWISDYLDGHLNGAERDDFESHRAGCPECRVLFKQIQEVVSLCRAFPEAEPPVTLAERILSATLGERRRVSPRSFMDFSWLRTLMTPQFAVGAGLVLCFIGLLSGRLLPAKSSSDLNPTPTVLTKLDLYTHKIYSQGIKLYNAKNQFVAEYNYLKTTLFNEIDYHLSQLTGQTKEPEAKSPPAPQQKPAPKEEKKTALPDFFALSRSPSVLDHG